jgi:hypothetical protein
MEFEDVWKDVQYQVKKHQVLYAPETRKMQVIVEVDDSSVSFTNDPTKKATPERIVIDDFSRVWRSLQEKGYIDETELRPLVGSKKAEFIWTVMNRLEYIEYDQRRLTLL